MQFEARIANVNQSSQPFTWTNQILPHLQLLNSIKAYEFNLIDGLLVVHFSEELNANARDFI